jgi:proteinaceous RNase P
MHHKRARDTPAIRPSNKQLINEWKDAGALYATATGSNDDW